jgi:hypothetical protein
MFKPIHLDFNFQNVLQTDHSTHTGSCIKHQVYELTDIHQDFGGFPETYCLANTTIHQLWWAADQIDFVELGSQLGMDIITISSICQPPGSIIPLHRDTFYQINQRYPDRKETKVRANIYLEDYQVGHFIQYLLGGEIETSTNWRAGDGFMWDSEVLHLSANAGMKNKYTLQVSGFLLN